MPGFERDSSSGKACFGGRPLSALVDEAGVRTPVYVYDVDGIRATARGMVDAFGDVPHLVAYAVKANAAGTILRALHAEGVGADVVSGAELQVALGAGIEPDAIVMSGVAKTDDELDRAIAAGIRAIQVESIEEIGRVAVRARAASATARISVRINPGVETDTHAHIATGHDEAKFGIVQEDLPHAWTKIAALPELRLVGLSAHVGSMLKDPNPYVASARTVCIAARDRLSAGIDLDFVDFGGGFGIDYGAAPVEGPPSFVKAALALLRQHGLEGRALVVEPGRAMVGAFGVLVASVVQTKTSGERRWVMIDAGMNDLLRPALYQAHHRIEPLDAAPGSEPWRVVGPVCESADDFGEHPMGSTAPSRVVVRDAGAYSFSMASEYNGRALPSEVFVENGKVVKVSPSSGADAWARRRLEA